MRLFIALLILIFSDMGPQQMFWVIVLVGWKWVDD